MSEQHKVNLGQFNQCVDYSSKRKNRLIDPNASVFYCEIPNQTNGECVVRDGLKELNDRKITGSLSKGFFEIPTFVTGKCSEYGVDHLLSLVELDILARIKETIEKSSVDAKFENVIVQIKSLQIFEDHKLKERYPERNGQYTIADYGIAVIVPAVESVV